MQEIGSLYVDPITSNFAIQIMAAMIGTVAFAILFGVPRRYYLFSGICGTIGWLFYILMRQYTGMSVVEMVVISTVVITLTSLFFSIKCKCPITVFLICGIFPLVPGEGIFRTTYNIVTKQLYAALQSGFVALEVTVAIAFGILVITEIKKDIEMKNLKIATVVGARPQFIKTAPVSKQLKSAGIEEILIHTGQHFDSNMSELFFDEMKLKKPDYNLNINNLPHAALTGRIMEELEKILLSEKPDAVLVYGDTDSTLAGAITAKKLNISLIHVEAGLRSYNNSMPEEINRILTDRISDILFCPSDNAIKT